VTSKATEYACGVSKMRIIDFTGLPPHPFAPMKHPKHKPAGALSMTSEAVPKHPSLTRPEPSEPPLSGLTE